MKKTDIDNKKESDQMSDLFFLKPLYFCLTKLILSSYRYIDHSYNLSTSRVSRADNNFFRISITRL